MTETQPNRTAVLGCIADDVTGATDLANNLVRGGMRVVQVLGVPDARVLANAFEVDAIVVALKTRSIPKQDAISQSLDALKSLQALRISHFYFKYCSTFDSTEEGNIGPVAEALMDSLGVTQTVFCPAFPAAGRTVYQGHLFVGDQLLNESGMQNHPLNPMTDANLVRFLGKQTSRRVGLVSSAVIESGAAAVAQRLSQLKEDDVSMVVTDTTSDEQLTMLASSCASLPLVTGGSGLARFLPDAYRECGLLHSQVFAPEVPKVDGRSLIVAGSCSRATAGQIRYMDGKCPLYRIDVSGVMDDPNVEQNKIVKWASESDPGQPVLIASGASPEQITETQERFGAMEVALAIENFLSALTVRLVKDLGFTRLVLAGGETSGAIVRELGIDTLRIGPEICTGVPWTESLDRERSLALALKSGNFGDANFFESALEMLR
ncbi:3-oxo-tetronate kinase [Aporhodopirellula aestuarii]|uniref:3-oxo-tetronate kinase n=1 Tax=Aporhodopirellula aestuarii TaxID=2950107 RepID=A0ABT0U152_9BACT|nr:3-oxo-tetronate kinase [Aporhodopirellula aestuarii]MCM2370577.1 four-carbon acid sugar kinase family protein [Aporhodopirellula aestuarii]